ncbi:nitric-oxide reductase large subunit [Thiocystis violacea]|uniref:nitric-oxide reductase large subunit n=1 Tax=Thiocystis violacea TaxID=13725 RepID=UPI0019034CAB|nr:cbb3-type cytochrome c oxidase subunit I [Thiocystis violacea]MBK1724946.1 nitric-oxide reductase large subunit [Thiocystis violacea]
MYATKTNPAATLSAWWPRSLAIVMIFGFSVLLLISLSAYRNAPPIPVQAVDPSDGVIFTDNDVSAGQQILLKYGLMDNGTIWGHGGLLGPDFSAETLHGLALYHAEQLAQTRFQVAYSELADPEQASVDALVAAAFKANGYDPTTGILTLPPASQAAFFTQVAAWTAYFADPAVNGGLTRDAITDATELRQLTAFFSWAAWAAAAQRPGTSHSYTNNFPYDPLVGNHPTGGAVLWSALSLVFLLAGIAIVLLAFGKFDYLGWHGSDTPPAVSNVMPSMATLTPAQTATFKFMVIAGLLLLAQTLIGGGLAHYRADPGSFYGIDLSTLLPSNLLRTWHLQLAIFWVATAYVGGALFVAAALSGSDPKGQRPLINALFWALIVVVVGSLLGQWFGIKDLLGGLWYWFGSQGWEYLEIGRFWQMLLVAGLVFWAWLLWRATQPARANPERRPFVNFFLIAAFAIPFFYLPAFFFGSTTHFSVVDVWRFWLIHLWVEGFFEFFVTVIVAIILYQLGLVRRLTAIRVIYLDAILYFGGGLIGTAHHWYFSGQSELTMALGATFSALEVVPLTLLTLDAWDFYRVTRGDSPVYRHRLTFYFLMAVGFWNFTGAGIFGFLINMPIVSYFEVGTLLTINHGHAAFVGVFGMLAVGLMAYMLREVMSDAVWPVVEKSLMVGFWGLNSGLALMILLSLFPGGVMQLWDVLQNGYWHARSLNYTATPLARFIEWMRVWGDLVFIFFGALPIVIGLLWSYRALLRGQTRNVPIK